MKEVKVDIWMPLYVGDYMGDTICLSRAQHGAYLLSMMAYWRKRGPLTTVELMEKCGEEFGVVSGFYSREGDLWRHGRIDKELAKAIRNKESVMVKSRKGVEARRRKVRMKMGRTFREREYERACDGGDEAAADRLMISGSGLSPEMAALVANRAAAESGGVDEAAV